MAVTYKKPVDDDIDWQQRLANYAGNKDAGMNEYQRALEVYRGKSAAGDTEGANAAKKWSDQVNTAIGGIGNSRPSQINNTLDTLGQKVNAQPFQFKQTVAPYNPANIQNDPAYQAALRGAQRNTQTAAGNTAALMNSRGIMDSTITTDRVGQQAQQQYGHVSDTILPQLMQQAYARYQDEVNNDYRNQVANYGAGQDQLSNLSKYAGTLSDMGQREADNAYRDNTFAEAQKQNNYDAYLKSVGLTGDLGTGPKLDYGKLGDRSGNLSLAGQQYADNKVQQGIENSRADRQLNANLDNMARDNARQDAAEQRIATGGTKEQQQKLEKEKAAQQKKMDDEKAGLISQLNSGDVSYSDAEKQIREDLALKFYTPEEAAELNQLLKQWAASQYGNRWQ